MNINEKASTMPQWFVSLEPSTRARTFMDSVKNKNKL